MTVKQLCQWLRDTSDSMRRSWRLLLRSLSSSIISKARTLINCSKAGWMTVGLNFLIQLAQGDAFLALNLQVGRGSGARMAELAKCVWCANTETWTMELYFRLKLSLKPSSRNSSRKCRFKSNSRFILSATRCIAKKTYFLRWIISSTASFFEKVVLQDAVELMKRGKTHVSYRNRSLPWRTRSNRVTFWGSRKPSRRELLHHCDPERHWGHPRVPATQSWNLMTRSNYQA